MNLAAALMTLGKTVGSIVAVVIVLAVVIADNFLPDSADEQLRRTYRGAYKRRRRSGDID